MRGKSIDNEFVISFIKECSLIGKDTPEEICSAALNKIKEIDEQLKARVKLSDVLSFFGYKKKKINCDEKIDFSFSDIDDGLASIVFDLAYGKNVDDFTNGLLQFKDLNKTQNLIFTLKTLIATKVLNRNSQNIIEDGINISKYY